jgi:hypothetical protein
MKEYVKGMKRKETQKGYGKIKDKGERNGDREHEDAAGTDKTEKGITYRRRIL